MDDVGDFLSTVLPLMRDEVVGIHEGTAATRLAVWSHTEPVTVNGGSSTATVTATPTPTPYRADAPGSVASSSATPTVSMPAHVSVTWCARTMRSRRSPLRSRM